MKELKILSLFMIIVFTLAGCSSSQETTTETETTADEEVYVFDEVKEPVKETVKPSEEVYNVPDPPYYIVQIGAFSSKDKADEFAAASRSLLENNIEVRFSGSVNLYVVQVTPYFKNRQDAETLRNKLWQMDDYKDAWILNIN